MLSLSSQNPLGVGDIEDTLCATLYHAEEKEAQSQPPHFNLSPTSTELCAAFVFVVLLLSSLQTYLRVCSLHES